MRSLWSDWPAQERRISAQGGLFLFLDYDGTLVPIAEHPSRARLPESMRGLVRELAAQPGIRIALVSGRSLKDLRGNVGLPGICYIGNHGLEVKEGRFRHVNPVAERTRPQMKEAARRLRALLKGIPGAWVEDKEFSLSVHYRSVAPEDEILVKNGVYETIAPALAKGELHLTAGKKVFEIRPPVKWTKGTVVDWLLARWLAKAGRGRFLPIYLGDDETDEDAFGALRLRGLTVTVCPATMLTRAHYQLDSPQEVGRFLQKLLSLWRAKERRSTSSSRTRRGGCPPP